MTEQEANLPERKHLRRIPIRLPLDRRVIYFVTQTCAGRAPLFRDAVNVRVCAESLARSRDRLGWSIPVVCFMPDHVHLFVAPDGEREQALSRLMQAWKSSSTQRLRAVGVTCEIWQREFFDRLLRSDESLHDNWEYVRANPLRAGLCADADDYPFSGTVEEVLARCSP